MTDQKESLNFEYSFSQSSTQVVTNSSQQDTKQGDSHQSIENTEQLASIRFRRNVSKT